MKRTSKEEAKDKITEFFSEIENKTPKQIKKIKKFAMRYNIHLGKLRKKFCGKCFNVFSAKNSETRIKNKMKIITCKKCENVAKWRIN